MNVGSLFSGIGGIEIGLERTGGFRTVWQCERDPFARAVLARHWPGVPCYDDVRALPFGDLAPVDVLCGGFPCQDISQAGAGAGLAGERSGLWFAYLEAIRALRPKYVLVENVAVLVRRGIGTVLGGLAASGYDAEWDCIPAAAVGAPHIRDRLFIVAYQRPDADGHGRDAERPELQILRGAERIPARYQPRELRPTVADAAGERGEERAGQEQPRVAESGTGRSSLLPGAGGGWWDVEPDVGRVAHGVPSRVDRLRCIGNAVVPQIPEWIGHRILERERVLNGCG